MKWQLRALILGAVWGILFAPPASRTLWADGVVEASADKNAHVWEPRTTSVAVFKNGLGFFLREGDATMRDGWCLARQIPPAAFGTLAIYSLDEDQLVDVVGSGPGEVIEFDGVDAPADAAGKSARLQASLHLNVQLSYRQHGAERVAAGKLVSVGEDFVVLESDANSFAVPLAGISKMQVLDLPLRVHVSADEGKSPAKARIGMAYLRKGITWIPEYTLKILDDQTAEITLRGTLVNEAEDLVHCDVNFVVGVPHFLHTEFMAPIAVGQVIRALGAGMAPAQVQSQIVSRSALVANGIAQPQFDGGTVEVAAAADGGDLGAAVGNLPQIGGPGGSDFTVYTKKDLTLRLGEKAIVTLFKKKIRFSHTYRWDPPQPLAHYLVLHNDTDTAWTTGPCLAISGANPLSEDLLQYTPKGGRAELPVTAASNVVHERVEAEVDRKLKAHSPASDFHLDLVVLEGELRFKNFEPKAVEINVHNVVPGKPVSASDEGRMAADPTQLKLLERQGDFRWSIKLEPGETKTLKYVYERYVPSN